MCCEAISYGPEYGGTCGGATTPIATCSCVHEVQVPHRRSDNKGVSRAEVGRAGPERLACVSGVEGQMQMKPFGRRDVTGTTMKISISISRPSNQMFLHPKTASVFESVQLCCVGAILTTKGCSIFYFTICFFCLYLLNISLFSILLLI